jgi:thiamine-phosphate pyrophosphorylase
MWSALPIDYACSMSFSFPKVYPILDAGAIPQVGRAEFLARLGAELAGAGLTLLEYRNKSGCDAELLADAAILRAALPALKVKLTLDDRVDLVEQSGFDGVHVDAGDATPAEARRLLGPERIVGTFGGSETLVPGILREPVDYLSIGPVFPTTTKQTTKAPIGVAGVSRLREQAGPNVVLVAVGGVTLETAPEVLAAGASVIGVSAAIFRAKDPAGEFGRWLHALV